MEFRWKKLTNGDEAMFNNTHVGPEDIPICLEIYNPDTSPDAKHFKTFGVFRSAHQFLNYIADTPLMKRCYFEIIRGSHAQKHYVDIDIKLEDDKLFDDFPHSIEEKIIIANKIVGLYVTALLSIKSEISPDDILVFNSNASTKRSYHIIVDRWFFPSATQNKELFNDVMRKIPKQYHKYFDDRMYKNIQQFRTMFSTKCGKNRFKVLDQQHSSWKLKGNFETDGMKMRELFYASLITEVTGNCNMLSFEYKEKVAYVPSRDMNNTELEIVIRTFRTKFKDASSFDIQEPKNSLIPLKRRCTSYCVVCQREHEAENPFLYVNFENKLFFNCRRNDTSQLIGDLNTSEDGSIINSDGEMPLVTYIPPSIPTKKSTIVIKPFVDTDFLDLSIDTQKNNEIKTYPHLESLNRTTQPSSPLPLITEIKSSVKPIKVTYQEKIEHQQLIDDAKARYNKIKPKGSLNSRLSIAHNAIALL